MFSNALRRSKTARNCKANHITVPFMFLSEIGKASLIESKKNIFTEFHAGELAGRILPLNVWRLQKKVSLINVANLSSSRKLKAVA